MGPVAGRDPTKFQHQGFGTLLMEEAERIAKDEHGARKLSVISGVGTRNYYWSQKNEDIFIFRKKSKCFYRHPCSKNVRIIICYNRKRVHIDQVNIQGKTIVSENDNYVEKIFV